MPAGGDVLDEDRLAHRSAARRRSHLPSPLKSATTQLASPSVRMAASRLPGSTAPAFGKPVAGPVVHQEDRPAAVPGAMGVGDHEVQVAVVVDVDELAAGAAQSVRCRRANPGCSSNRKPPRLT